MLNIQRRCNEGNSLIIPCAAGEYGLLTVIKENNIFRSIRRCRIKGTMLIPSYKKAVAFLVILITVVSSASGIYFKNEVLTPLEENLSAVALLCASDEENGNTDFKPPKNSYVDYAAICSIDRVFSEYLPSIQNLAASEPFQFIPEVYLDIFVPPQNQA